MKIMSSGSHSRSQHLCNECGASFFTKEGLEKHFQRQHGNYCDMCPIDTAIQKSNLGINPKIDGQLKMPVH